MNQPDPATTVLSTLTTAQKAALTSGTDFWHTTALPEAGVPRLTMTDGPHGLRRQPEGVDSLELGVSVPATCFPPAVGLGSSWNPTLVEQVGAAIAAEARAAGVGLLLGPGVNIKRSPLCGRNFEYVSEDPFLSGRIGAALIRGIQAQGVGACVKHFAANNQETDRVRVSADVDERTLREIYLPAFEHAVTTAHPAAVMASYNKINGTYSCENPWLLAEVLRGEWGFDGLVISDWGAVDDRAAALAAGCDLAMPTSAADALLAELVERGELDGALLDASAGRVLALVDRATATLAQADQAEPVDLDAHHELARRAAHESAVLLKNADGLLPLDPAADTRIAVIGELARTPRFQGGGSSHVVPTRVDNALDAIADLVEPRGLVRFAAGYTLEPAGDADAAAELIRQAAQAARTADTVLLFLGLPESAESEGADRTDIALPAAQVELVHAVAAANPRTVVVLSHGSAVELTDWRDEVPAILEGWLLGQAGGSAVADLLFGRVAPSGRLTETIPLRLQDTPSYLHFPGGEGHVWYGEGLYVGYRGYDTLGTEVAYPFGHGLTYTTFAYSGLRVGGGAGNGGMSDGGAGDGGAGHGTQPTSNACEVEFTLTNTGAVAGAEVVQLYVSETAPRLHRPAQELKAFAKVTLEPGASTTVTFQLDERAFAHWSPQYADWVITPGAFELRIGASSRDTRLSTEVILPGTGHRQPLTARSSLGEWLADPRGLAVLVAAAGEGITAIDAMGAAFPLGRIAALFGFGPQDVERLCEAAAAEAAAAEPADSDPSAARG
ncbi:glycoside hydrolase family 3 C-terminal domain-containing protein [Actinospica durhamensis]|uniref:Exo-alpha-(1->6)-L-arabinopyranosidase n=1 Tax=Actinospica durhamensis TaxID=1508375 RepID=A0A941F0D8_9ACTN|nr:glycoside hydrolase family 3 C-terminal domain-containing protein [Actinospica durhamensis]MBR7837949.1 glycoside hydrolase family 3 C-terminal domain-containing protein [Actinospica durhamensis]